ncbi:MAG: hypothetical protein IKO44_00570 [Ruminococcus sp.]|nr:hypothetical protein [Ruminococcus sp.]
MTCNTCGYVSADGAKFCRSCGSPLSSEPTLPFLNDSPTEPQTPEMQPVQDMAPVQDAATPQPGFSDQTQYAYGQNFTADPYAQPVQNDGYGQPVYPQPGYYPGAAPVRTYPAAQVKGSGVSGKAFLWLLLVYFLCGMLFVSLLARFMTSKSYLKDIFKEVTENVAESDEIVDAIESRSSLDEDEVRDVLENTDFSNLLSKYSSKLAEFVFEGGSAPKIDSDEIVDAIEDNERDIEKAIGRDLNSKDWEKIRNEANKFADDFNKNIKDVKRDQGGVFSVFSVIGSTWFLGVLIGAMLLILLRLIFLYKKDGSGIYRAFRGYAIVFGIRAAIFCGTSLGITGLLSLAGTSSDIALAKAIISMLMKPPLNTGLILGGVCVVFIVLAVVFSILYKKKKSRTESADMMF